LNFNPIRRTICFSLIIIIFWPGIISGQNWQSSKVQMDASGKLTYTTDDEGNRIPDFSYAGYRNSEEEIPFIKTVSTIEPVAGDNTNRIQNAINAIANEEPDVNGFRGALYLEAGEYEISGILYINQSGVVLRGAGDGAETSSNTILKAVGDSPHQRTVLIAGGGSDVNLIDTVSITGRNIVTDLVTVGSQTFEVEDAIPFQIGDNIIIYHPCTDPWLQAIEYGGTFFDPGWTVGSQPLVFNRYIKNRQGNMITVDAPVFNHLNRALAQSRIYKCGRDNILTNIGIENLRIDIVTNGGTDENHAWNAIGLYQLEDAWVKNCTMRHFGLSGIRTANATRVTIDNCQALDPHSIVEGGKRYNFHLHTGSQLILFKDCHATNGRHHYISNGASSVSGCVFYNCTSSGAYTSSEGHRRWSMGLLFDNHRELDGPRPSEDGPRRLGLYNRGSYGTGHGWAAAHSVCWNCDAAGGTIAIQKPPTAQNYAIGCFGDDVTGTWSVTCPFPKPAGYIDGTNSAGLEPGSLFLAQLSDRQSGSTGQTDPIVDTFSDGDFTENPRWTGDTDKWQVVFDSDVSLGAPGSYTLRLNETTAESGTKYLSCQRTASWGSSQSWGIWMGRRHRSASDANQSILWLWANESDLTSLTVDGYRIQFGNDDTEHAIVLQRVDNGTVNDILSSSDGIPNGLTDIGILVRVTRTAFSQWTLFTSVLPTQNGQGAVATDIPSAGKTHIYQGSVTDATYINFYNGYFGLMAVHTSDNDARTAVEFDQLYFDTSADASLPVKLISFTANAGDGEVKLNWTTASEIGNIGFSILRGDEEKGNYSELDSYRNNIHLRGAGNRSEEQVYQYIDYDVRNNVNYWYKLLDVNFCGIVTEHGPISATPSDRMIKSEVYGIDQNYPNPFNPTTMIKYQLPTTHDVELSIYNILGQKVATLVSERQQAGQYQVPWDASLFSSGIYYYKIQAGEFNQVKKMILIR
jgi:hypothetical protein